MYFMYKNVRANPGDGTVVGSSCKPQAAKATSIEREKSALASCGTVRRWASVKTLLIFSSSFSSPSPGPYADVLDWMMMMGGGWRTWGQAPQRFGFQATVTGAHFRLIERGLPATSCFADALSGGRYVEGLVWTC